MVQNSTGTKGKRKHRARFANSVEGRHSQIQYKLGHGIRGISPVLLGVEREEDWRKHFEGVCKALAPGNEFELDLAFLLAWQLWRFSRLIRHETALTSEKIHKPPESIFDVDHSPTVTKQAILDAITRLECERQNGNSPKKSKADSNNSLLARCRAIESRAPDVMFDPSEVREILGLVLEQVRSSAEEEMNEDADYGEADTGEENEDEELEIEERSWSAGEIAEQIQILSDAAGVDWREELSWTIESMEEAENEHARQIDEARRHVLRNLVLDERDIARLALYERQINSQFK
jgi:hypothetical protein